VAIIDFNGAETYLYKGLQAAPILNVKDVTAGACSIRAYGEGRECEGGGFAWGKDGQSVD
jgi:hypothetical protein